MCHRSGRDQRTKKIPASGCDQEKAPDQKQKQKNDNPSTCESKLFTNNWKDHIILCLRYKSQLLYTVSDPDSEYSSGSNRVKPLQGLITLFIFFRISPDSKPFQPIAFKGKKNPHKAGACDSHQGKLRILRTCHKDQDHTDSQNNDRRA